MNFGFTEEQDLLRRTARDFLTEHAPMKRVREIMEGSESHAADLWSAMAELGWTGLALPEKYGGAGLELIELALVLEEMGRALAPVPFVPSTLASLVIYEKGDEGQKQEWLPPLCGGRSIGTLAITEAAGTEERDDLRLVAARSGEGWSLRGRKLFVPDAEAADLLVVVARTGGDSDRLGFFLVPQRSPGLRIEAMRSMDQLRPLYQVNFEDVELPWAALLGADDRAGPDLSPILDLGRVMLCAEMVGGADRCLEDSVAYAKERIQFGKPIGVNQAIKHKCADMLFQVESAKSITYYAAWAARERNDEAALAAAMAKAYVSDAYRHVSAENIQIHGGVGFTWEYDCHLYFKRAKSDESWLGDGTHHRERVARMMNV